MIATFPSRHYNIEEYPAVKEHLLSFGMERLEQTGNKYKIKGDDVHARKKTNNKWFETQDSISYWEDFSRQKLLYPDIMRLPKNSNRMKNYPYFYLDKEGYYPEATLFMMTGKRLNDIYNFLCSDVGFYVFSKFYMGPVFDNTGFRYKKEYLLQLPVPFFQAPDSQTEYESFLKRKLNLTDEEIEEVSTYKNKLLTMK